MIWDRGIIDLVREQCCKDNMRDSVILIVYNLFIVWSYPFSFFVSGHINHISWQQFAITAVSKTQKTRFISDNRWGLFSTIWKKYGVISLSALYKCIHLHLHFQCGKTHARFQQLVCEKSNCLHLHFPNTLPLFLVITFVNMTQKSASSGSSKKTDSFFHLWVKFLKGYTNDISKTAKPEGSTLI